jgi:chromosome segregation ATPase
MRLHHSIVTLLLLGGLVWPTLAVAETTEALSKRVKEMEKANLVLQEDLARTQLALDTTRTQLKTAQRSLEEETAARKALSETLTAAVNAQKDLANKLTALTEKVTGMGANQQNQETGITGLTQKVNALEKSQTDQAAKHDRDVADLRTVFTAAVDKMRDDFGKELAGFKDLVEQKFAALRGDLDNERNERLAADETADQARAKIAKQQKKDRTITYVMGAVLGGLTAAK